MNYHLLREFADSWGLVLLGVSFLTFVGWVIRPAARDANRAAKLSIFRDEERHD